MASKVVSAFSVQRADFLQDCQLKYVSNKQWVQLHILEESFIVGVPDFLQSLICFCLVEG